MSSVNSINPNLLTILAAVVAIIISQSGGNLNVIGEFITTVGDLVSLEAAQIESRNTT